MRKIRLETPVKETLERKERIEQILVMASYDVIATVRQGRDITSQLVIEPRLSKLEYLKARRYLQKVLWSQTTPELYRWELPDSISVMLEICLNNRTKR